MLVSLFSLVIDLDLDNAFIISATLIRVAVAVLCGGLDRFVLICVHFASVAASCDYLK